VLVSSPSGRVVFAPLPSVLGSGAGEGSLGGL